MIRYLLVLVLFTYVNASDTPIIGILAQESYLVQKAYPDVDSFIIASYVKLVEASGARVLPIWIGQDADYYKKVVNYTNGLLFPGGGVYFNESGGYGEAARQLYEFAVQANEQSIYYPIWGICLGMQVLMYGALGFDIRGDCSAKDISLPLDFASDYYNSRIFASAPADLIQSLKTENITYNYHRYCLFESDLKKNNVLDDWTIISKNKDVNGLEFISTMEHKKYPFYGTQYHPEKNSYEFKKPYKVAHSPEAIELTQYLGNFFITEARKNNQSFTDAALEFNSLIYNFEPVYSANGTSYEQLYLFTNDQTAQKLL